MRFINRLGALALSLVLWGSLVSGQAFTFTKAPVFPLHISSNGRTLLDASNRPFPVLGRAAWGITSLSVANYQLFINDTVARGFTAIEVPAPITPDGGGNGPGTTAVPADGTGDLPFLKQLDGTTWSAFVESYTTINTQAPDFTTPNSAYWSYIDGLFNYAASRGILVCFFPSYVGFASTHQGWMDEMVANGTTSMQTYGAWIASRYANQQNILWLIGGDRGTGAASLFSAGAETNVETSFITGLLGGLSSPLVSAEWARNSIGSDQTTWGSDLTVDPFYVDASNVNVQGLRAYAASPTQPSFMIEEPYEDHGGTIFRQYQWWAMLSGIGGYLQGDNNIWPFVNGTWQSALSTTTVVDLQRLNQFWVSIPWSTLAPQGSGSPTTLVTAGGSTSGATDYVSAASASDKSLLVAYIPPGHSGTITIDMTSMRGSATSRWFDPVAGIYRADATGLSNSGTHVFTTPGTNSGGQTDWVLRLDA